MSKHETIKIDDIEYVRKDAAVPANAGDIKIAVLDRGFVYIGRVEHINDDFGNDWIVLHNAKNIRIWGTTKGLGELVNGPLSKTALDMVGTVRVPFKALISLIDVEQSKWKLL